MRYRFELPDLGEGIAEGEVVAWLVEVGDEVAEDAPLVEVETDKAEVEIPSPVAGEVVALHVEPGAIVPVGSALVEIETAEPPEGAADRDDGGGGGTGGAAAEAPDADGGGSDSAEAPRAGADDDAAADAPRAGADDDAPAEAPRAGADDDAPAEAADRSARAPTALPAVRRLAREFDVDLAAVTGSGPDGRVTEKDVRAAAESPAEDASGDPRAPTGARRTIARRLTAAAAVPTVTNVTDAAMDAVRAAGVPPLVAVCAATVAALGDHPRLNAHADADGVATEHDAVHLGIATQGPRGLIVPVVRDAHDLDLDDLAAAVREVTTAAREGRVSPDDLRGSTFTVTSAGKQSGLLSTPLLNLPEVAILGLYRVEERPVVRDGQLAIGLMANLTITFDHRVLDGMDAAAFLTDVIEELETWPADRRVEEESGGGG